MMPGIMSSDAGLADRFTISIQKFEPKVNRMTDLIKTGGQVTRQMKEDWKEKSQAELDEFYREMKRNIDETYSYMTAG